MAQRLQKLSFTLTRTSLRLLGLIAPQTGGKQAAKFILKSRRLRGAAGFDKASGASEFSLEHDDHRLQGWQWGEPDKPLIILVHGVNGRASQLAELIAPLLARGFRVVAFDALGHGRSDGSFATLQGIADSVAAVVGELGVPHGVLTHSAGAPGTVIACSRGVLLGARLVFIAPPCDFQVWVEELGDMLGVPAKAREFYRREIERITGQTLPEQRLKMLTDVGLPPLLVIHDEDDKEVAVDNGRVVAGLWSDAQFLGTKGLGHRRILRDPCVIENAVSFLAGEADWQPTAGKHMLPTEQGDS
jgi:pimeloyl-ACP methyl ester carboxylesterase